MCIRDRKTGFYDYANKYQAGAAEEICPSPIPEDWEMRVRTATETVSYTHLKALGVRVTAVLRGAAALLVGEKLKTDVQHGDLPSFL